MMAVWRALIAGTVFGIFADAIPTIAFPLNSQVPPVARIGEPFSYSFSRSTFSSSFPITYTLSDAPSWLSLENNTRTLSGIPLAEGVGANTVYGFDFGLTASDQSGSTTLDVTLVVSKNRAPIISVPATTQLESFGVFSAPSTLPYHPSTLFKFQFDVETFSGTSSLTYYAVTRDNTPLPSWVVFDPKTLSFGGQTPDYVSLIQPPQTFGIQLIASDVEGFSGVSITFDIEVGVHVLGFVKSNLVINAASGVEINFNGLAGSLELDGIVANASSLSSVIAQTPSWLAFNNSTFTLSGIPPTDANSYNVTVEASDIYGDVANTTVLVDISTAIFIGSIQGFNATIGTTFSQNLSSFLRNESDIDMTAELSPATSWLAFNPETFVLSGQVPSNIDPSNILITLDATSKTSGMKNSESFQVHIISKSGQMASFTSKSSAATTSATQQSSSSTSDSNHGLRKNVIIAITIPIVLTFIAILFCFLYYLSRRHDAKKYPKDGFKSEISAPLGNTTNVDALRPTQTVRPIPALELDTSGFSENTDRGTTTPQKKAVVRNIPRKSLRRSQTVSVVSGIIASELADAQSAANRVRANSENALSSSDPSWRSTQDSNYQTSGSRANSSQRLSRNYSNYSRKGHIRRSAQLISASDIGALRDNSSSAPLAEGSILNLSDNNFSASPLDNFTVLSHSLSVQTQPTPSSERLRLHRKSAARNLRFIPTMDRRRSGIGHGRRESISTFSGTSVKRRSIGHGQDPTSPGSGAPSGLGLVRDSRTWLTVDATEVEEKRCISNASDMTESTDLLYSAEPSFVPVPLSIKEGPVSPVPRSFRNSNSSTNARPVSRRIIGSSPFFGGGLTRNSRRSNYSKHIRTSFADSPTVPEEAIMGGILKNRVIRGLRDTCDSPHDPLDISYGLAREGTRQLKSFVQNQLTRTRTRGSMKSIESKDSRFESANASMYSLSRPNTFGTQRNVNEKGDAQDEYEDYLPDNDSEGSWETHHSRRESRGNAIEYTLEDSAEVLKGAGMPSKSKIGMGDEKESHALPNIGPNARMVSGRGKRPDSVVDVRGKGSMRAKVERSENDYTAYI